MNREERRHPSRSAGVKQFLNDLSTANRFKTIVESDWPIHNGDKVRLNIDAITKHTGYQNRLESYREFCEGNAGRVLTVESEDNLRPSVVSLKEDTSSPKWLFWIGDLEKVQEVR